MKRKYEVLTGNIRETVMASNVRRALARAVEKAPRGAYLGELAKVEQSARGLVWYIAPWAQLFKVMEEK